MSYQVTEKYIPPAGSTFPAGEHYEVVDRDQEIRRFRWMAFYRTPHGREVITDEAGDVISADGDLGHLVKGAVEAYDQEHPEPEIRG